MSRRDRNASLRRRELLEPSLLMRTEFFLARDGVHAINQRRSNFGEFSALYYELRCHSTKFYNYTRMSLHTFDYILEKIRGNLESVIMGNRIITPEEKLFLTLRFLSTGISFRSLAFSFRVGKTTVRKIVYTTCTALWSNLQHIHLPVPTVEILNNVADKYFNKWQFPNCVGAIDGKHCRIKNPLHAGSSYYNYKHFFSMHLQALADADKRFLVIEVGGRGRQSDGGTFHYSNLNKALENNRFNMPLPRTLPGSDFTLPMVIIGDEAYPLKCYLMRPYPQNVVNPAKELFNKRLSRARKCVECAFGILCAKWRILNKAIETNCVHARLIIKTTCLLHNIIIDRDGSNDYHYSNITSNTDNETRRHRRNNHAGNLALNIREKFKEYFVYNNL